MLLTVENKPEWIVLDVLLVLPPELRPMLPWMVDALLPRYE